MLDPVKLAPNGMMVTLKSLQKSRDHLLRWTQRPLTAGTTNAIAQATERLKALTDPIKVELAESTKVRVIVLVELVKRALETSNKTRSWPASGPIRAGLFVRLRRAAHLPEDDRTDRNASDALRKSAYMVPLTNPSFREDNPATDTVHVNYCLEQVSAVPPLASVATLADADVNGFALGNVPGPFVSAAASGGHTRVTSRFAPAQRTGQATVLRTLE